MKPPRLLLALTLVALAGCATLPAHAPEPPVHALRDVADTRLAQVAAAALPPGAQALSGFRLLPEGETAFNARIALARRAGKSIDAQYYLIQNDDLGQQFLRELRDAARRGVRVRLLVDDLYAAGEDDLLSGLAAYTNVDVRIFNPLPARAGPFAWRLLLSMREFDRINHRMHNKLFIADNSFAVSGGRNRRGILHAQRDGEFHRHRRALLRPYRARALQRVRCVQEQRARGADRQTGRARARRRGTRAPRRAGARAGPSVAERPHDVLGRTPVAQQLDSGELSQGFAPARVFADTPDKVAGLDRGAAGPTVTEQMLALFATARSRSASRRRTSSPARGAWRSSGRSARPRRTDAWRW